MHDLTNALLNLILVSIPEELFLTSMTLILLKRFDMLDIRMWKYNLKWIMLPVLLMGLDVNITRYILDIPRVITSLSSLLIFFISFTYMIWKNSYELRRKDFRKIIISISLSFIIFGVLESITVPIVLFLTNKTLEFFNSNIMWNFMLSLPSRVFSFSLVIYLIIKYNSVVKIKVFDVISKNNFLLWSIVSFSILSNILAVYGIKLIGIDRILDNKVSMFGHIFISMSILVIPTIVLFWILLLINYIIVKEKQIQQTYESLVRQDDIMLDVED